MHQGFKSLIKFFDCLHGAPLDLIKLGMPNRMRVCGTSKGHPLSPVRCVRKWMKRLQELAPHGSPKRSQKSKSTRILMQVRLVLRDYLVLNRIQTFYLFKRSSSKGLMIRFSTIPTPSIRSPLLHLHAQKVFGHPPWWLIFRAWLLHNQG